MNERRLSRRHFLGAAAFGAGGIMLGGPGVEAARRLTAQNAPPIALDGAFRQGVASGQPATGGITLWTRIEELDRASRLQVEISPDRDFRRVIHRKSVVADPAADFSISHRAEPSGLAAGSAYFYRFFTCNQSSPIGRFKTALPADSREPVRIGFGSCQDWTAGLYNAHAALAAEDLDLFVHLGDYIYESGGQPPLPGRPPDLTGANGDGDAQTLAEYRDKMHLYRSDPDLQALHAAHPVMATWDDHDVEVDWAGDTPGRSRERRVPYEERRRAAKLAFFEAMPRIPVPEERDRVYGTVRLGANADVLMLDLRSYRTPIPCAGREPSFSGAGAECTDYDNPSNTILGERQRGWLAEQLRGPGGTWRLLASSVMMMGWDLPPGNGLIGENWDGYSVERDWLVRLCREQGRDAVVMSGDAHGFFAGTVTTDGRITGQPGLTEFLGGALASDPAVGANASEAEKAAARTATNQFYDSNPHWSFLNFVEAGYGVVECGPDELRATFKAVRTRARRDPTTRTLAEFRVERGRAGAERLSPALPVEP